MFSEMKMEKSGKIGEKFEGIEKLRINVDYVDKSHFLLRV